MQQEEHIVFGPFLFGLTTERLWREEREIPLRQGLELQPQIDTS